MTTNKKTGLIAGASLPILGIAIPLIFFPKSEKQLFAIGLGILGLILALPITAVTVKIADKVNPKGK